MSKRLMKIWHIMQRTKLHCCKDIMVVVVPSLPRHPPSIPHGSHHHHPPHQVQISTTTTPPTTFKPLPSQIHHPPTQHPLEMDPFHLPLKPNPMCIVS